MRQGAVEIVTGTTDPIVREGSGAGSGGEQPKRRASGYSRNRHDACLAMTVMSYRT